jgi:hypothetical protein
MEIMNVDCRKNWQLIDELIVKESSDEKQRMLKQIKRHMQTENAGDLSVPNILTV